MEHPDDAVVYQLDDERALIQTVDFFTPVVDDPRTFGRIAAANALSDVYAMGGRPLLAMNIVCFPGTGMDVSILEEVLQGGAEIIQEAGALIAGGHSVDDPEIKYGLAVTGEVHPQRIIRNRGARPGDVLVLTKPLGTGIITTAIKADLAAPGEIAAVTRSMETLNRDAARVALESVLHAGTDVTGFGLLGHAAEMVEDGDVGLEIQASAVPLLAGVREHAAMGLIPAGAYRNEEFRREIVTSDPGVHEDLPLILADPQTSGGLLLSVPAAEGPILVTRLHDAGVESAAIIGSVTEAHPGRIRVLA